MAKASSSPSKYTKPALREQIKARVKRSTKAGPAGKWTARKAQLVAAEYERAGGGYRGSKRTRLQKHLKTWGDEHASRDAGRKKSAPHARKR